MNCRNILSLLALAMVIGFSACTKDQKANREKAELVINDFFLATSSFEAAFESMDESAQQQDGLNGYTGPEIAKNRNCGDVEFAIDQDNFFPAILSINYGSGCEFEGHDLSGRITATFNGFLFEKDKSIALGFDVFSIDEYSVDGGYALTNRGLDAEDRQVWEHFIEDGQLSGPNGYEVSYGATATTTQIEGQNTHWWNAGHSGLTDDVWEEVQSATYVNPFGNIYTVSTASPMIKNAVCPWPISGVIEITGADLDHAIEVDFGTDSCDAIATVTFGDISFEISLK